MPCLTIMTTLRMFLMFSKGLLASTSKLARLPASIERVSLFLTGGTRADQGGRANNVRRRHAGVSNEQLKW